MPAWAACVLLVALALCIAARLAEQACRMRGLPTRACWFAALALSVLLPIAVPLLPASALPRLQLAPLAARAIAAGAVPQVPALVGPALAVRVVPARALPTLALALSAGMLSWLAFASIRLQRRARGWRHTRISGLDVLLAPQAGPAVFGWWRPRVVLPEWLGREPTTQRGLALAHERSHLQARDPQLLAAALLLLAAMPWNLPLWWQLRRLRCAIEIDCDRRVLRAGGDLVDYCETLIELGQHGGSQRGLMAAVSEPQSLLERRIRIMSARPFRRSRSAAIAFATFAATLATCAVALATELAPSAPVAPKPPGAAMAPHAPPAAPAPPSAPARLREHAAGQAAGDAGSPGLQALEAAKLEAEEAQERADEAKADAEAAEEAALEAKRDAEQQAVEAQSAKHEAEAAAAEAAARKQDVEEAERALKPTAN